MEDKVTVIELNISPAELEKIVERWAIETKFSIYEKNQKSIMYSKNIRLATAWLSIEGWNENTKIIAWLAPKGRNPDDKGNAWSGWKMPIPNGIAFGPASIYRKQFNKLVEILKSKSNNIVITKQENKNQPKIDKGTFIKGIAVIGIIEFLLGAISAISASTFISVYPDVGTVSLKSGIFNMVLGILTFISSRLLKNGKALAIWLYSATVLINVVNEVAMGHKFPYFSMIFGAFITWQLLTLKKEWELS